MSNTCELTEEQRKSLLQHEKKKAQDRARSKAYYDRHSRKVLDRQKIAREVKKKEMDQIQEQLSNCGIAEPEPEPEPQPEPQPQAVSSVDYTIHKRDYTKAQLLDIIKSTDWTHNTKVTYNSAIKRIFKAGGCDSLKPCLDNINEFVKTINEDKKYGTSSKIGLYQILGKLFDTFNIGEHIFDKDKARKIKTIIVKEHKRWKFENDKESKNKKKNNTVPDWKDYLSKTKTNFGEDSKEYLVAYLYSNLTLRDNYKEMAIVKSINETNNEKFNYFVFTSTNKMTFVINRFKTDKKYNRLVYKVEIPTLKKLLKKWIEKNKLQYGMFLFGKTSLSSLVSKINRTNNYSYNEGTGAKSVGGINFLRHMTASALPNSDYEKLSFDEREELANSMLHSMATNEKYRYNLNIIEL